MRNINAWLFMTLDGVMEAPEKWAMADDDMYGAIETDYANADTLLLGRRTYETFAASWPQRSSDVANADWMNNTRKLVASTTLKSPAWNNTSVIDGDVSEAVARLKEETGQNVVINGSAALVRSLLRDNLLDELKLYVHPVVVGAGRRLFEEDHFDLSLAETHTYDNGVILLAYTAAPVPALSK